MSSTILLLKSVAVVKFIPRKATMLVVVTSTTIPKSRNVVITTPSSQERPHALATEFNCFQERDGKIRIHINL